MNYYRFGRSFGIKYASYDNPKKMRKHYSINYIIVDNICYDMGQFHTYYANHDGIRALFYQIRLITDEGKRKNIKDVFFIFNEKKLTKIKFDKEKKLIIMNESIIISLTEEGWKKIIKYINCLLLIPRVYCGKQKNILVNLKNKD